MHVCIYYNYLLSDFWQVTCFLGCGAKNLTLLQNECKPSQLEKLINLIAGKKIHKGKNHSIKWQKNYFRNGTLYSVNSYSRSLFSVIVELEMQEEFEYSDTKASLI
jgi:hypothetical protein